MQQWKFFRIPVNGATEAEDEFNRFLRSRRVLAVHREFVVQGESSYWALAVEHLADTQYAASRKDGTKKEKVDYREILSPDEFSRFARLREWRKQKGQVEAVPVYTILTNEQMAEIVRNNCRTKADLAKIEGIGTGRLDRYGAELNENIQLNRTTTGVPFLGMRVYPQKIRLSPRSRSRFSRKLVEYEQRATSGEWSEQELSQRVNSLIEFTTIADTKGFRSYVMHRKRGFS